MKIKTDYTRDQNPKSIIYADEQGITPEYVKQAAYPTEDSVKDVHANAFAYPGNRLLPLHTKEAAYLSAVYFYGEGVVDELAETRIKRAAVAFDIEKDVHKVRELFNQISVKSASETETTPYALEVLMDKEAGVQSFYPVGTANDVETSADQMSKDYHEGRLPLELYFDASRNLMKKATELGVPSTNIPKSVNQLGTPRAPDFTYAESNIKFRKAAGYLDAESYDLYSDIIKGASHEFNSYDTYKERDEAMIKWAEAMLELDRMHNIDKLYNKNVKNPYDIIFSGPTYAELEKAANETVLIGDNPVPLHAIRSIPEYEVNTRFTQPEAEKIYAWQKSASAFDVNRDLALEDDGFHNELLRLAVKYG